MLASARLFSFSPPHLATVWPKAAGGGHGSPGGVVPSSVMGRLGVSHHHVVGAAALMGVVAVLPHIHHPVLEVVGIIVPDPI